MIDPSKILTKIKLHLLAHTRADIIRFGPLVGVATESFECYNAIFRFCSIHSNHLAPSRDIAQQLAGQEGLKHRVTGGWWPSPSVGGDWVRSGPLVRDYMQTQPMLQGLLGWKDPQPLVHGQPFSFITLSFCILADAQLEIGTFKLEPMRQLGKKRVRTKLCLSESKASAAINFAAYDATSEWFSCKEVVCASLDECIVGSWVFAKSPVNVRTLISLCLICY